MTKIHKDHVELSRELAFKLAYIARSADDGGGPSKYAEDDDVRAFAQALNPRPKTRNF